MRNLIGKTVEEAIEECKSLGKEIIVIENNDKLDVYDCNLVTKVTQRENKIEIVLSKFLVSI